MAKEEKKVGQQPGTSAPSGQSVESGTSARPNRDKYSSMFVEDNPDIDFEDKEARYGRMAQERDSYRKLRD